MGESECMLSGIKLGKDVVDDDVVPASSLELGSS